MDSSAGSSGGLWGGLLYTGELLCRGRSRNCGLFGGIVRGGMWGELLYTGELFCRGLSRDCGLFGGIRPSGADCAAGFLYTGEELLCREGRLSAAIGQTGAGNKIWRRIIFSLQLVGSLGHTNFDSHSANGLLNIFNCQFHVHKITFSIIKYIIYKSIGIICKIYKTGPF